MPLSKTFKYVCQFCEAPTVYENRICDYCRILGRGIITTENKLCRWCKCTTLFKDMCERCYNISSEIEDRPLIVLQILLHYLKNVLGKQEVEEDV